LTLFTFLLVVVAALQWRTLEKTDRTLRLQERAWLTPVGLETGEAIAAGKDLPIKLFYANLGKGPALNMHIAMESVTVPFLRDAPSKPLFAGNNLTCEKAIIEVDSVPIFPVPNKDQWHDTFIPGGNIPDSVVNGGTALLLRGCIKYLTVDEVHTTSFCYVAYRGGVRAAKDNTVTCADGNYTK